VSIALSLDSPTIPAYSPDGRRRRNVSAGAVERLLNQDKIVIRKNKNGRVTCVQFLCEDGANPLQSVAHGGTKYSFQRRFGLARVWVLKNLAPSGDEDADLFVRCVFRAVPLSVLTA
jgi:hypothetical protein